MARKATGQVIERESAKGTTFALRFRAYGARRFLTLGDSAGGWDRARAEDALRHTMSDVERGLWQPPRAEPEPSPRRDDPDFRTFASEWFEGVSLGLGERTREDYLWRLSNHLLPFFQSHRLSEIDIEAVDTFRRSKEREGRLSNGSINKLVKLLRMILEQATEYGYVERNVAAGRKRLLRESKPSRSYLQPEQVAALLAAAGELDAEARYGDTGRRRPLLAVLTLAGLRIGEALDLRWRDVNLAARKLQVVSAKTEAGVRAVDLSPTLQEVLSEYKTRTRHAEPDHLVFGTSAGKRDNPSNIRNRLLRSAVEIADAELAEPIGHATPHGLRRTFASLLLEANATVPYAMAQLGHEDPKMTLGIYAKVIESKTDHGAALDGLVGASHWAQMGTNADPTEIEA